MNVLLTDKHASARALIDQVHQVGDSLENEYPLVFGEGAPGRLIAVGTEEEVRSACALLVRRFRIGEHDCKGGQIGSVSTHADWRSKGYATRMLIEAEAQLQAEGCAFALLWADDAEYYIGRGYAPMGTEMDFVVTESDVLKFPHPQGARSSSAEDVSAIHDLYLRHHHRVDRSLGETTALLDCPGMETFVLERDGQVRAYACMGRGRDLADTVHEWGGDARDVLALVRALHHHRFGEGDGSLFVMAPASATDLIGRLATCGVHSTLGILGLGKILDRQTACALLQRCVPDAEVSLVDTEEGQRYRVAGPDQSVFMNDDGVLTLLFGNRQVRPEIEGFLGRLGLAAAELPLEPFAWGLDSI